MKRSNRLLLLIAILFFSGLLVTDRILVKEYALIDLADKFKNFETVAIEPFRVLHIQGGNGYAVHILQGAQLRLRVAKTRKSFLRLARAADTLRINFTVANQQYQKPEESTIGLIIEVPALDMLELSGTNNQIGPFTLDRFEIRQDRNTVSRLKNLTVDKLTVVTTGAGSVDFRDKNTINELTLTGKNQSIIQLSQVMFQELKTDFQDSSRIVLTGTTLALTRKDNR